MLPQADNWSQEILILIPPEIIIEKLVASTLEFHSSCMSSLKKQQINLTILKNLVIEAQVLSTMLGYLNTTVLVDSLTHNITLYCSRNYCMVWNYYMLIGPSQSSRIHGLELLCVYGLVNFYNTHTSVYTMQVKKNSHLPQLVCSNSTNNGETRKLNSPASLKLDRTR